MSLDFYLYSPPEPCQCVCDRCGNEHTTTQSEEFYWSNITHNLNKMAKEAEIYEILWRPDEVPIMYARDIIKPLHAGIELMKTDPERFKLLSAPNGWGTYEQFIPWLEKLLAACEEHPEALVRASR